MALSRQSALFTKHSTTPQGFGIRGFRESRYDVERPERGHIVALNSDKVALPARRPPGGTT